MAGSTRTRVTRGASSKRRPSGSLTESTEVTRRRAAGSGAEGSHQTQIAEIQRARLLAAAARALDELGYEQATVATITDRARVSRRTFYELFANREECLAAVLEEAVARLQGELAAAGLQGLGWRERMRLGLWTILCFMDREPVLARVCIVQSLRGGAAMLARREQLLARLAAAVDEGRAESDGARALPALTAEGLVSAAVGILYSRLSRDRRESLRSLQGELMAMIALPYLGATAARREQRRPSPAPAPQSSALAEGDPLQGLEMRITYRTARVLEGIAELPGSSNRQVAERAGILDQGQVSKLLARLERLGLLANTIGDGRVKGEPNAWRLTDRGAQVARSIRAHTTVGARAGVGSGQ